MALSSSKRCTKLRSRSPIPPKYCIGTPCGVEMARDSMLKNGTVLGNILSKMGMRYPRKIVPTLSLTFGAMRSRASNVRLSVGTIFRGYLMPILDKMFPKTVPFFSMESRAISTPQGVPMQYFGGMGERERSLVHRLDDDSAMFGMQFNVNLYDKDRALEGSAENGVTGLVGQLNRARGTETNYRYWAEGAWNPRLKPKEFYAKYSRRIFGEQAQQDMMAAFETREANEECMGWVGRSNFNCCSVLPEIATAYQLYRQPNPFEGPVGWEKFISQSHDSIRYFTQSVDMLKRALRSLEKASQNVAPRGRAELNYLRNKTESYILLLQTLITARRAYIAFGEA